MIGNIQLSDYATKPLYNIKAIVQATGITPSTLRAWERRYDMCQPQRSESGYRLYSERDLAVIRWLKTQVDAGMSISQAVAWMDSIVDETGNKADAVLPGSGGGIGIGELSAIQQSEPIAQIRDYPALQRDLLVALLEYDEGGADEALAEAFSMYTVEQIGENLVMPVLVEIGDRWRRGEVSVTAEHFASNYLLQRLSALLRAAPGGDNPLIWVGCAPGELHEVGAMLLSVYLRRAGYSVHYFGQNLPIDGVSRDVSRVRPDMILLSASTEGTARQLGQLTTKLAESSAQRPLIGYGGRIFNRQPDLRSDVAGVYMGASAEEAVEVVNELLRAAAHSNRHR